MFFTKSMAKVLNQSLLSITPVFRSLITPVFEHHVSKHVQLFSNNRNNSIKRMLFLLVLKCVILFLSLIPFPPGGGGGGISFRSPKFHTLYRKSDLRIPRNETARPRSQFLYLCICEGLIYFENWSVSMAAAT
jgi:hypothetical protein